MAIQQPSTVAAAAPKCQEPGETIIGHFFMPRDAPLEHQCRHCGWPKKNHLL